MSTLEPETLAEFASNLAKSDPAVALVISDVRKLDHLRDDAGWQTLYRRILEQRERYMLGIAKRLMAGQEVSPLEIASRRSYFQGALDTVRSPEKAAESLEKAATRAFVQATIEETEGADAPFT